MRDTVQDASERLTGKLAWLEYVAEDEFTDEEKAALIAGIDALTTLLAPIVNKYID